MVLSGKAFIFYASELTTGRLQVQKCSVAAGRPSEKAVGELRRLLFPVLQPFGVENPARVTRGSSLLKGIPEGCLPGGHLFQSRRALRSSARGEPAAGRWGSLCRRAPEEGQVCSRVAADRGHGNIWALAVTEHGSSVFFSRAFPEQPPL